jgi:hyperosmotically inducible protein
MNATSRRKSFTAAAFAAAVCFSLLAPAAKADDQTAIRTALNSANVNVGRLNVVTSDGIVFVHGQVTRREQAQQVGEVVRSLGYARVANLVRVVPIPDDEALVLEAERQLSLTRSLEGCRFSVAVNEGVVTLRGTVDSELQKDLARTLLQRIDGVRSVRSDLRRG